MSQLALSTSFEYMCYGSTAIINILLFRRGDIPKTSDVDVDRITTESSNCLMLLFEDQMTGILSVPALKESKIFIKWQRKEEL